MLSTTWLNPAVNSKAGLLTLLSALTLSACQSNTGARIGTVINSDASSVISNTNNPDEATSQSTESTALDTTSVTDNNKPANKQPAEPRPQPATEATAPVNPDTSSNSLTITRAQTTGNLQHPALTEVSGMASSTRQSNAIWAINDSGNTPTLFAFNQLGQSLGSWPVNANNRDWEDLASAWINGESYLLIADFGDNLRNKNEHTIHIIAEPVIDTNDAQQAANSPIDPLLTLRYRYPDAFHNAEALAVGGQWIYILTKEPLNNGERQASSVYRIPLTLTAPGQTLNAQLIAQLAIPANSLEANLIASIAGVDVSQPTAFDIDRQNRTAYVLTYRSVYRYKRGENQSWAEALAQPRQRVHSHSLSQAEALAVDNNGVIWFTSEKRPAPLWALPGE